MSPSRTSTWSSTMTSRITSPAFGIWGPFKRNLDLYLRSLPCHAGEPENTAEQCHPFLHRTDTRPAVSRLFCREAVAVVLDCRPKLMRRNVDGGYHITGRTVLYGIA